jgi:subtilisin family serine protease
MDTECNNVFYNEDYYDFLMEYGGDGEGIRLEYDTNCFYPITYQIASVHLMQKQGAPVPYEIMPFSMIPKCYGLMDEEALREMGVWQVQNSSLDLTGRGVLIGFVDTGIDYTNPVFQYEDGSSKILSIWDQSIPSENPPEGFYYGSEYRKSQIEEAIRSETPYEIVPSKDTNGHGTYLAGVAAGRRDETMQFAGCAPDAELVIVKLKEAKQNLRDYYFLPEKESVYSEVDIMRGIHYLFSIAYEQSKPIVVCIGLGSNQGAHTGTGFLSSYLNLVSARRGVAVVIACGNEGSAAHHYHGKIDSNRDYVELKVGKEKGFTMELWGKAPYRFQIQIESPSGQTTEWMEAGIRGSRSFQFLFEKTQVYVDYLVVDPYSGDQGIFFRFASPSEGIWKIGVAESAEGEKEFDLWLPITGFIGKDTVFLRDDPFMTITSPANAGNPMAVTAYSQENGALYLNSSRGYTKNQLVKPDFGAPGVNVLGPLLRNQFGRKSGTSVSAALVAGMSALFLQWAVTEKNDYVISTIGVKNYFIRGAVRDSNRSYPNRDWGYGKVNLYEAFLEIR